MCGILIVHNPNKLQNIDTGLFKSLHAHRGPDGNKTLQSNHSILIHDRLAIVDLGATGDQPFIGCEKHMLIHNGEIYNHEELREALQNEHSFQGRSDSETILHVYEEKGVATAHWIFILDFLVSEISQVEFPIVKELTDKPPKECG